jgi:nitrate reductase (NAD(P)H)
MGLQYHIGTLVGSSAGLSDTRPARIDPEAPFLEPKTWKSVTLAAIERVNHDSLIYRFVLSSLEQPLGLPVGQHVFVRLKRKDTGEIVQHAYTPVSRENTKGYIDFLIKYVFLILAE